MSSSISTFVFCKFSKMPTPYFQAVAVHINEFKGCGEVGLTPRVKDKLSLSLADDFSFILEHYVKHQQPPVCYITDDRMETEFPSFIHQMKQRKHLARHCDLAYCAEFPFVQSHLGGDDHEDVCMSMIRKAASSLDLFINNLQLVKMSTLLPSYQPLPPLQSTFISNTTRGRRTKTWIFLDMEATGLLKYSPNITELCMIAVKHECLYYSSSKSKTMCDKLVLAIEPDVIIPEKIVQLTGLSNYNIRRSCKRQFSSDTAALIGSFLSRQEGPVCLVAHGGSGFDFPLLQLYLAPFVREFPILQQLFCVDSYHAIFTIEKGRSKYNLKSLYTSRCPNGETMMEHEAESDAKMLQEVVKSYSSPLLNYFNNNLTYFVHNNHEIINNTFLFNNNFIRS